MFNLNLVLQRKIQNTDMLKVMGNKYVKLMGNGVTIL